LLWLASHVTYFMDRQAKALPGSDSSQSLLQFNYFFDEDRKMLRLPDHVFGSRSLPQRLFETGAVISPQQNQHASTVTSIGGKGEQNLFPGRTGNMENGSVKNVPNVPQLLSQCFQGDAITVAPRPRTTGSILHQPSPFQYDVVSAELAEGEKIRNRYGCVNGWNHRCLALRKTNRIASVPVISSENNLCQRISAGSGGAGSNIIEHEARSLLAHHFLELQKQK
ncbi:unnamed protein product, partial [Amoebophrya sp. A25]